MRIITSGWIASSLVVLGVVGGCADPRPSAEVSESGLTVEVASATSSTTPAPQSCTPGAARECKTFWHDHSGRIHCTLDSQICRADGYAWQACGDHDAGPAPDAGADADEDAGREDD